MKCNECKENKLNGLGLIKCPYCGSNLHEKSKMFFEDNIVILLILVCFIVNLIIAISIFGKIGTTGEFAGWLIKLGKKINVAFIGLIFTSIFCVVVHIVNKYLKKYIVFISPFLMFFMLPVFIGYYNYAMYKAFPEELKNMKIKGNIMLARSKNKITDRTIVAEDSAAIINYFNNFLDTPFYRWSDTLILEYSSKFSHLFRRPYEGIEIFDSIETNKYRQIMKHNMSIDFFSYSPDNSKLFLIMTYEIETEASALALIGERNDSQIILYRYGCITTDYKRPPNKQYALYWIITRFERQNIPCNIGSPLKKSFWNTGWYEKVYFNNAEKYRYQLKKVYKWNEIRQLDELVLEEIETFIVIEK